MNGRKLITRENEFPPVKLHFGGKGICESNNFIMVTYWFARIQPALVLGIILYELVYNNMRIIIPCIFSDEINLIDSQLTGTSP